MGEKKKKKYPKQRGSALRAGGAPIQKGVKQKGRGMTDAAGSKVTLQGAGRSRRTVRATLSAWAVGAAAKAAAKRVAHGGLGKHRNAWLRRFKRSHCDNHPLFEEVCPQTLGQNKQAKLGKQADRKRADSYLGLDRRRSDRGSAPSAVLV